MKIYIKKSDNYSYNQGASYQIYPTPQHDELINYFIYDLEDLSQLTGKIFLIENDEIRLVNVPPSPAACYDYDWDSAAWQLNLDKKLQHDSYLAENKKNSLLKLVKEKIDYIIDKIDVGRAIDDDLVKLKQLKILKIDLVELDITQLDKINWEIFDV
jgi:hypothetical protein